MGQPHAIGQVFEQHGCALRVGRVEDDQAMPRSDQQLDVADLTDRERDHGHPQFWSTPQDAVETRRCNLPIASRLERG
jgi:hypothetical protein